MKHKKAIREMKSRATALTMMVLIAVASTAVAQGPDTIWTRTYGREDYDVGSSVRQTADGGYIVAGYTWLFGTGYEDDVYLIKTDASGDTLWTRTYGGAANDRGNSVQQTANGGYIVTGYTWSFGAGHSDVFLIKTNGYGGTLWTRTYGGADNDWGTSVQQTADGGYIVAGWTDSFSAGDRDVYLIKTNGSGISLWTRTYGGADDDGGNSVQQTADGGYIVTGYTWSFGTGHDYVYLIKTDASGNTLWTRTYGGGGYDFGFSVQQTADGGYIVAGKTGSFGDWNGDVYLIKTDASGNTLWTRTYGGAEPDGGNSVQQTADGGYVVAGFTYSFGAGDDDVYLIRLDSETGFEDKNNQPLPRQLALNQNYPNPFNASTRIDFEIPVMSDVDIGVYDIIGRRAATLFEGQQRPGHHSIVWDAGDIPSGIYFARLRAGTHSDVIRMTLLK
jgi:hypothetical protein